MPTIPYKNAKGERIPGVTTILNNLGWKTEGLKIWANKEGLAGRNIHEETQTAADIGTVAHYLIECDVKGIKADLSPYMVGIPPEEWTKILSKAETSYLNFLEWKRNNNLEIVATEMHLVSEKHQVGGTIDAIAKVNKKSALLDYKTGKTYEDALVQTMSYKMIYEENFPDDPLEGGIHILRVNKEMGGFDHKMREFIPEAWEVFLMLRQLHDLHKTLRGYL